MTTMAAFINRIKEDNCGFLRGPDIEELKALDGLAPVLVRCGGGRFQCAAQDAEHFLEIIASQGSDYVRDVGLVAGHRYKEWVEAGIPARPLVGDAFTGGKKSQDLNVPELVGTLRAIGLKVLTDDDIKPGRRSPWPEHMTRDYGGAEDGMGNVFSDADPGL